MKKRLNSSRHPIPGRSTERLSVSLSSEEKQALEAIAIDKRVSLAWVVRDAISNYLTTPNLTHSQRRN